MKLLIALVATLSVGVQHGTWPSTETKKTLYAAHDLRGKKAPAFHVEKWVNTKGVDTKGKVVLIDYWATWCGPCRALIPELNQYAKKFKGKLVVIGISDEPATTVQQFLKTTSMQYNVGIDTKRRMANEIGVEGIPHVTIISPDGIVRWQGFPGSEEEPLTYKVIQQIVQASDTK